jgi:hypothetical protein
MSLDDRLHEEIAHRGDDFTPDPDAALRTVLAQHGRRQHRRRVVAGVAAAVILLATVIGVAVRPGGYLHAQPVPADHPSTSHQTALPGRPSAARDSLTGEWQSVALPAGAFRAAMLRAGASPAVARHVLAGAKHWVIQMTFSSNTLDVEAWDPAEPARSLQFSPQYGLARLSGHRVAVSSLQRGVTMRAVLTCRRSGEQLRLRYGGVLPSAGNEQTAARFAAWASAPLTLVHAR